MPWYLWQCGEYIPDYSIGKNESFIKLNAKTLEEAKYEVGLFITEENANTNWHYDLDLPRTFKNDIECSIKTAKLFL